MSFAAGLRRDPRPLGPGLYSTDAFHRRPLFAVEPPGAGGGEEAAPVVASWEEALALHGPLNAEAINPAWLAALISDRKTADQAPYRRIVRLPRAHHVAIQANGSRQLAAYDPLAGGAGPLEPEALHALIRAGLLSHLRAALDGWQGPIGCEHSSGIDSNAVLGGLVRGLGVAPERIHTWSMRAAAFGLRKAFPLLDETLIGTLLQQDPMQFGEVAGRGRLVARRAFEPFLAGDPPRGGNAAGPASTGDAAIDGHQSGPGHPEEGEPVAGVAGGAGGMSKGCGPAQPLAASQALRSAMPPKSSSASARASSRWGGRARIRVCWWGASGPQRR